ncbi:MAG: methionyl-tRNA formyltransferase [Rhodobacterales bacterium]|jgi:methionyl-tRNA formyltransferase|nr:methionyl-tRNA formyltransferase [Rhodobacterales bacterium]
MHQLTILIATPYSRNDVLEHNIRKLLPDYQIVRIKHRDELTLEILRKYEPEFIFFPHWSWIIPQEIFTTFDCVIFHMTDLPYGRGGSPLQNLVVRGHKDTMMSALKCEAEMDAGPIYLKMPLSLNGSAEQILKRASSLIEKMIVEIVKKKPIPHAQQGEVVEFKRRKPEDGNLAGLTELDQIYDYIRMLDGEGYPPAFLQENHIIYEFTDAITTADFIEVKVKIRKNDNE